MEQLSVQDKSPDAAINPKSAADRLSRISNPSNTVHFLHMVATGDFAGSDRMSRTGGSTMPCLMRPILAANHVQTNVVSGEAKTPVPRPTTGSWTALFKHCISATSFFGPIAIDSIRKGTSFIQLT